MASGIHRDRHSRNIVAIRNIMGRMARAVLFTRRRGALGQAGGMPAVTSVWMTTSGRAELWGIHLRHAPPLPRQSA